MAATDKAKISRGGVAKATDDGRILAGNSVALPPPIAPPIDITRVFAIASGNGAPISCGLCSIAEGNRKISDVAVVSFCSDNRASTDCSFAGIPDEIGARAKFVSSEGLNQRVR